MSGSPCACIPTNVCMYILHVCMLKCHEVVYVMTFDPCRFVRLIEGHWPDHEGLLSQLSPMGRSKRRDSL